MHGPLAQVAALALHGNRVLSAHDRPAFYPGNSTFRFCSSVTFVALARALGRRKEVPYAPDPTAWFERLGQDGVLGLRLLHRPGNDIGLGDRMSAGLVGGGGRWLIEAVRAARSDVWEGRWATTGRQEPDNRIWTVTYVRVRSDARRARIRARTAAAVKEDLGRVLPQIATFAEAHGLAGFARSFDTARALLDAADPLASVYHQDIAPPGLLHGDERALLAATQAAWVFGAMGSWNDLGFEARDQRTYVELSEEVFVLLNEAIAVAVNSTFVAPIGARSWWQLR